MSKKIAIVLFNLGGPDCKNAIKPFLMNFFMDKNIINAPWPVRYLLAKMISIKRSKAEAGESYGELGDKSPLLDNTEKQSEALESFLNDREDENSYKTFVSMRYWHPMAPEVVEKVKNWHPDKVILLPLYPQFSTTTSWSSLENWKKALSKFEINDQISMVCCYPKQTGFIEASAQNIAVEYKKAQNAGHAENIRFLFSAHGLPEKIVKSGDPYQYQCEKTAEAIVDRLKDILNIEEIDWQSCYQSRVGRLKWIDPSLDDALDKAAKDNKSVLIFPHAFTQEHVETLVELDIEYKEMSEELGIDGYYRAHTVGSHPAFIDGLAELVNQHIDKQEISADGGECICPDMYGRCCMREA